MADLLPVANERGAPDLDALRGALAAAFEQGRAVNIVYAPTTVHHHTTSAAPVPVAPSVVVLSAAAGGGAGSGHPGIDVDLTGYGQFAPPVVVAPLPAVPETRSWAPMVLLVSGWSGIGGVFATAVTGGNAFAIGFVALALAVSAGAFSVVYRANGGPR